MTNKLPLSSPAFAEQVNDKVISPMMYAPSGEAFVGAMTTPLGAVNLPGRVKNVWLSVGASGKDDTDLVSVSGEVSINGVSVLSTTPSIQHVSGESSQQKTTKTTGDTGITQAIVDQSANSFVPGDVITNTLTFNRTASPTTEMSDAVIVVELEPLGIHRRS